MKTDAEILREAKMEALGLRHEEREYKPHHDRPQMATDELVQVLLLSFNIINLRFAQVMERFKKRMRK